MAAYPVMIAQGSGHIVNTASLAGLTPVPGFTAYAATKHAVVGLSISLRGEAARRGVRVSVVCPGVIDTPLKDSMTLLNVDRDTAFKSVPLKLHSPAACARVIVRGVERNRAIITVTGVAKLLWLRHRLSPALTTKLVELAARRSPLLAPAR
jgi:short-subunit dehydrogenase